MRVFLTGGTGYVGAYLVAELLRHDHQLTLLARDPDKLRAFPQRDRIRVVPGRMEDADALEAGLADHEAVIHNAICWEDELALPDCRASVQLFQAAAAAGVGHLLYTSSTAVHRPFQARMEVDRRLTPTDLYGATKAANEAFLSAFSYQTSMRCTIVRPGPVVGPPAWEGAPLQVDRRFSALVADVVQHRDVDLTGYEPRQFTPAAELARLYAGWLLARDNRQTYLAVEQEPTSWRRIAEAAISLCGSRSRLRGEELPASRFLTDLGLDAFPAIQELLRHLIDRALEPA